MTDDPKTMAPNSMASKAMAPKGVASNGLIPKSVVLKTTEPVPAPPRREISAMAQQALDEAAERRRLAAEAAARPLEIDGRGGAEPVRFGDWEVKGLAVDF